MIGRALDVLNAPGSTKKAFQALFRPRNLGNGDIEELIKPRVMGGTQTRQCRS